MCEKNRIIVPGDTVELDHDLDLWIRGNTHGTVVDLIPEGVLVRLMYPTEGPLPWFPLDRLTLVSI